MQDAIYCILLHAGLKVSAEDLFKMFTKLSDENIAVRLTKALASVHWSAPGSMLL